MVSLIYILVAAACFLLWLFPGVRCALTHPFHCIYYGVKDGYNYIRYKKHLEIKDGALDGFEEWHKAQVSADPSAFQDGVKIDWSAAVGGGEKKTDTNAAMNNLIRGALK